MRFLSEDEAQAYYKSILHWGTFAGILGLSGGTFIVRTMNRYYTPFRSLTPSIKYSLALYPGFLGVSAGTNHASQLYQHHEHPEIGYISESQRVTRELKRRESSLQKLKELTYEHRYMLCGGTWATTITSILLLMRHDHLMTGKQKLVQARMAAQASTIVMLLVTTAMEIQDIRKGRGKFEEIVIFKLDDSAH